MSKIFSALAGLGVLLAGSPAARAQQPPPAPVVSLNEPAVPGNGAAFFSPANEVQRGKLPFTLRQVFHRLAHDQSESMPFTEARMFAISKNLIQQTGTLRSSKEYGLSLSYENPKPHVIIVDDKGLIERQPGGGERQVTVAEHPELAALTDLYLNLLRGNVDKLFEYADVYYTAGGQTWQMGLVLHDANVAKHVGKVVISGGGRSIRGLANVLPNGEARTLEFGKIERNPKFPPDVIQTYFRAPNG